tara:strand:+ start:66 stop:278 length:213 start_codon:yes stop_codon:yes gene_type:complete
MSYIKDDLLREEVKRILTKKRRFHLIKEIQSTGEKFSYTQLANFLNENEVTISTLKTLDRYVKEWYIENW